MSHIDALNDHEYRDEIIDKVEESESGYALGHDGWTLWCPKVDGIVPKVGDTLRMWGRGFGYTVRGIAINGRIVRYETAQEERERMQRENTQREMERLAEAEANRESDDQRIAALPEVFQRRIQRFRDGHPDFWWQHQPYELFVCEQAVLIAQAMKEPDDVPAFANLDWKQQKLVVPGLSGDHSGNTFGAACRLAHWYLTQPENVVREHGALVVLVGCAEYGCTHGEDDAHDH
jgi:hypothetical protein